MTTISPLTPDARAATVAEHYRRLADRYDEFLSDHFDYIVGMKPLAAPRPETS